MLLPLDLGAWMPKNHYRFAATCRKRKRQEHAGQSKQADKIDAPGAVSIPARSQLALSRRQLSLATSASSDAPKTHFSSCC